MNRRIFAAIWIAGTGAGAWQARVPWGQRREAVELLAKFQGVLLGIDRKFVRIEVDGENTLEFRRTGKTAFYKAKAKVKPEQIPQRVPVLVEGTKNMAGELIVANVIWDGKSEPVTQP